MQIFVHEYQNCINYINSERLYTDVWWFYIKLILLLCSPSLKIMMTWKQKLIPWRFHPWMSYSKEFTSWPLPEFSRFDAMDILLAIKNTAHDTKHACANYYRLIYETLQPKLSASNDAQFCAYLVLLIGWQRSRKNHWENDKGWEEWETLSSGETIKSTVATTIRKSTKLFHLLLPFPSI